MEMEKQYERFSSLVAPHTASLVGLASATVLIFQLHSLVLQVPPSHHKGSVCIRDM